MGWVMGLEEGGLTVGEAKNMPVACFLARGRVHEPPGAPRKGWERRFVLSEKLSVTDQRSVFFSWGG